MLSSEEGELAVRLARSSLEHSLGGVPEAAEAGKGNGLPKVFDEPRGVFVTLRRHPSGDLRGCVGFPLPVFPLRKAIPDAAMSAATEDPRFSPVGPSELGSLTVEVSILTVPVPVRASRPEEMVREIQVGRDGLIVDGYGTSGLLLPQVAPEQGWSSEELLEGTCEKAGLPPRAWRDPKVHVRRFEAEVFTERLPAGDIVREKL
ncbi:MAG: TIGR00296 family protein [Thermoplasmata archaeon]